ncbi:MAG: hypothetical protein AAFU85_07885, partial [Planctomycetota bacterium]
NSERAGRFIDEWTATTGADGNKRQARRKPFRSRNDLGELMADICPEIVAAAEGFSTSLTFIPVSASGCSPLVDEATGALGIRPRDMEPFWVEIPMLMALHNWAAGLVGATDGGTSLEDGRWMTEEL